LQCVTNPRRELAWYRHERLQDCDKHSVSACRSMELHRKKQ
jgi:hypothetical protein